MMMTNKEKYKQAFCVLHASNNISWEVNKNMSRKKVFKPRRKLAVACMCLALTLCAGVSVYAAANYFLGYSIKLGDKEISKEVENVPCKELTDKDISQKYFSISELEQKMGIDLLESNLSYEYKIPNIEISKCDIYDSLSYSIYSLDYYVSDMELSEEQEGDGHLWNHVGDKPLSISYQADIFINPGKLTGMEETFFDSEFLESYTTGNGIQIEIYKFGSEYGAYIEKDNVIYKFTMDTFGQADIKDFKYFLDTLK